MVHNIMRDRTVFISYRRDAVGKEFARSLKTALEHKGYDVFPDVDDIDAGLWASRILPEVPRRALFLLLLTPGALDRCSDPGDWVRCEFEQALASRCNIVPVREESVDLAELAKTCPDSMRAVFDHQIAALRHGRFDADIATLLKRYIPPHYAQSEQMSGPAPSIQADISRIIKYAPAELIGREAETGMLDDAWEKVTYAKQSVAHADRSGESFQRIARRTTHADALHQAGQRAEAEALFREAEALQAERQPQYPLLYSVQGFRYCDLLLAGAEQEAGRGSLQGEGGRGKEEAVQACREVAERAARTLKWAEQNRAALLDIALDHLTLGRASLYAAILDPAAASEDRQSAIEHLDAAVTGLRRAGAQHHLPRGLLSRAWLRALTGPLTGPESTQADLNEAWEIAERGPMPLFLADIHLYRLRVFTLARSKEEGLAYPWQSPHHDLAEAKRLIEKHGYGRRLEELADTEEAIVAINKVPPTRDPSLQAYPPKKLPPLDPFLLTFWLVLERQAPIELLAKPDPGGIREAMLRVSPELRGEELRDDVWKKLAAKYGGISPNPLWHAWMQTVREKDIDALWAGIAL